MELNKEEINKKANHCLGCKVKMCMKGCPLENDITRVYFIYKRRKI